jgi:hypothetical protein
VWSIDGLAAYREHRNLPIVSDYSYWHEKIDMVLPLMTERNRVKAGCRVQ